jgi:hypothetical protein
MGPVRTRTSDTERPAPGGDLSELELLSTTISVVEERMGRIPYMLGELKSERERYTLVAAIVAMIVLGTWVICVVVERRKASIT